MKDYQKQFVKLLAYSKALFFDKDLRLKDGRPTPYFVNMGIFGNEARLRDRVALAYGEMIKQRMNDGTKIDIIFGPSYKGSMLACDVTSSLWKEEGINLGCSYDRKEVKAHGEGSSQGNMIVGAELFDGANIYIVDDVATSMGTKKEALEKIAQESERKGIKTKVVGIGIAFDREQVNLEGRNAIRDFTKETRIPVDSIVRARETMSYLLDLKYLLMINGERQPMNPEVYDDFQRFMDEFGTK